MIILYVGDYRNLKFSLYLRLNKSLLYMVMISIYFTNADYAESQPECIVKSTAN